MKRYMSGFLAMLFILTGLFPFGAEASAEENQLEMAFGLFSVVLPAGVSAGPNTGNELSSLRYETDGFPGLVYGNFAPTDEYEASAKRKLDSYVSLMYALCGDHYSETDVAEETLENGIRIRWQLMKGDNYHALWFEAFTDQFGYNLCLYGKPDGSEDEALLALMRSFSVNTEQEKDILEIRQTRLSDDSFISAEHGLRMHLDSAWNPVSIEYLLLPQTAFVLEKGEGRCLIQLLYTAPVPAEDTQSLLKWYVESRGGTYGEPYTVTLEGLGGVEAWVMEEEMGIMFLHVAFVYESYGYFGSFMWLKQDDAIARPYMDDVLKNLSMP